MGKKLKQKAAKFTPPRNRNTRFDNYSTKSSTGTNTPRPTFSLRDELSNTEKHRAEWTPQSRLRDHKISFVSAGSMQPLDEPKVNDTTITVAHEDSSSDDPRTDADLLGSESAMAQMNINSANLTESHTNGADMVEMDVDTITHVHAEFTVSPHNFPVEQPVVPSPPFEDQPAFFIDTEGDQALAFKGPKATFAPRAPSPARSNSSDEVVLFRGRAGVTVRDDPPAPKPVSAPVRKTPPKEAPQNRTRPDANVVRPFAKALENPPDWAEKLRGPEISGPSRSNKIDQQRSENGQNWPSVEEALGFTDRLDEDLSGIRPSRKGKKGRKKQNRIIRLEKDLEDELLRDYIENIAADDLPTRNGDDDGHSTDEFFDGLLNEEEKDQDGEDIDVTALEVEWTDEDSAEGSGDDEDEDDDDDDEDDEEEEDEDSSDLEGRLEEEEREAWEDDEDLRERRIAEMDDEQLARLFAKQQELGFDGEDIVIFDDRFGDVGAARSGLADFKIKDGSKKGKKKNRKSDQFPDASLLADVLEQDPYGGFDVMDFDRPSLRRTSKGRKSAGPLPEELAGLSDDDMIRDLQDQWQTDRSKKAKKKAEREELRQLGLIGSGKKNKFKPDLNQRYDEGITMVQLKVELREFLEEEDHSTKAFPPMLKNDRKVLHEIANHFNLKSKSVGSGKNRAPVLIKTSRTREWSESHFTRVQTMVSRSYLKNSSKKPKSNSASEARRGRQDGAGTGAASYRNGDIVGQHASEIPETNFGRKLMEKMGWSAGKALGKEGSTGLLVPVEARVKSGKAGLG